MSYLYSYSLIGLFPVVYLTIGEFILEVYSCKSLQHVTLLSVQSDRSYAARITNFDMLHNATDF